jgi:hypothetical protein
MGSQEQVAQAVAASAHKGSGLVRKHILFMAYITLQLVPFEHCSETSEQARSAIDTTPTTFP